MVEEGWSKGCGEWWKRDGVMARGVEWWERVSEAYLHTTATK